MANFTGLTDTRVRADVFGFLPGLNKGIGVPFPKTPPNYAFVDKVPFDPPLFGAWADGGGGSGLSKVIVNHTGLTNNKLTFAGVWFERMHILPRAKIEFGNIITLVEDVFELYNAHRNSSETLLSITNNVAPGVVFPDVSPPVVVPALTSILDPSTTNNSGGAGLGTLVKTKVQALQDGLPTFDGDAIFVTTSNDPVLLMSGTRIVLIPYEFEVNVQETLAFLTDMHDALDGHEQRIALRKQPRQSFNVKYALEGLDRQGLQALLFDWMDNLFGLPLWHERVFLTAAVSSGATTYPISGGDDVDFRVGGLAVVISDRLTFDVIQIDAVTDVLVTAASSSLNAYAVRTALMPVRTSRVKNRVALQRELNNLERFSVNFQVDDNDTGALAGDTTPGFWSTHAGRVLFDDCNVVSGSQMRGDLRRRIHRIDNQTGKVGISSLWDRNKRGSEKGFLARNRAEIMSLRKLFIALRGRQKAFYIPTFIEEITANAPLAIGTDTMDIDSIGYVRFARDRLPMSLFRITFTDATSLVRTVSSSAIVSPTIERLTLNVTWPANRTVAEVQRIEWYELVRFDSDSLGLNYSRIGEASARMPLLRVFDDN